MKPTNQPQVKLKGIEYLLLAIQSDPGSHNDIIFVGYISIITVCRHIIMEAPITDTLHHLAIVAFYGTTTQTIQYLLSMSVTNLSIVFS